MKFTRFHLQIVYLICGLHVIVQGIPGIDLKKLSKNQKREDPAPPNAYLARFLEEHSKPIVKLVSGYQSTSFDLNIDSRYDFKPPIKTAPFSSTGEPWPLPKKYKSEKEKVLRLDREQFKISVLNQSCDILTQAIKRYTKIIKNHVIEEHYEFVFNYDEKTKTDRNQFEEKKYEDVRDLPNLEIEVASEDCGYPHINMEESYQLVLRPDDSRLRANQVWGAIRGLETFSQLLFRKRRTNEIYTRVTEIEDEPRFPHRGILLDTSRHFIHKFAIKNVLDGMAYNKMNVLHWHIVDDNSFPYQSEVFPKLSENGAFHPDLVYSLGDIKELVEYARYRGIRVLPEFDSPGHTFAWLGYPEIKSTCYVNNSPLRGPMGPIDPTKNMTYLFMSKLFSEIYDVFPEHFVHLGGDELHSLCWASNPEIRDFLQKHGDIPAYEARYNVQAYVNKAVGYYFKRLIETLKRTAGEKEQRKAFIMWEDVLKNTNDVPRDSILQVWMGQQSNVRSLNDRGYRALYSSCWYLDNYKTQPMWPTYYKCDPSPYYTEAEEKGKILGGEACLWAEYITTDTIMSFMWPRASAPAERLWSPKDTLDMGSAARRLQEQRCRMIFRGLPTGHISGPDYCLRPKDGPLDGLESEDLNPAAEPETQFALNEERGNMSIFFFSHVHRYLPFFNIMLTAAGVYIVVVVAVCRKRRGFVYFCPNLAR